MRATEKTIVAKEVALDNYDHFSCNINGAGNITMRWYNDKNNAETVIELNAEETYEIANLLTHIRVDDLLPF